MGTAHPVSSFPLTFPIRWNSNLIFSQPSTTIRSRRRAQRLRVTASSSSSSSNSTRLVTFLGKGGSGKTTSAILAALYYANSGLNTCLVIQSQDPSAEYLMGCKIGTSPTVFNNNLSAVRLETTKMILEPLNQLKQADAHLKLTQGVLEGVVGEELGVLPGMDSIFTALALSKMMGLLGTAVAKTRQPLKRFDVVIYDGISNEETLRMIGMAERARWYLKYLRNMAEKIDIGRLTAPSLLRLVEEATSLNVGGLRFNGKMSSEIWDELERILEKTSAVFSDPSKFGCYVVLNPESLTSVNSALRYWGCTIQSGAQVSGAFGFIPKARAESAENIKKRIAPLPFAFMPYLSMDSPIDMDASLLREDAQNLLSAAASSSKFHAAVNFDQAKKSVTLFMPGFDKSEIKLYQYRGGSELLVEAGDQRRVIRLPPGIQGKVGGAKFTEKSLVITMR